MNHALTKIPFPSSPTWIWSDKTHPNQTILFRAKIDHLDSYEQLSFQLTSQTRYYAWSNGNYLGQGPCPTPWPDNAVDGYQVSAKGGCLTLSVIVHYYGVATQSHPNPDAGLWVRLIGQRNGDWTPIDIPAENWRYLPQGGWLHTELRRTWATGWMEQFDASKHPTNWQNHGFNDEAWRQAATVNRNAATLTPRKTPALREWTEPAKKLLAVAKVSSKAPINDTGEGQLGKILDEEPWEMIDIAPYQVAWDSGKGITISPSDGGLALVFDLGEQMVGQTEFTIEAKSGIVDHYGAELLRDGRPWAFRGNAEYATRWFASDNSSEFRTLNYNGFRYLLIVLRPQEDPIHLKKFGVWRRQADITPSVVFHSQDAELQRLWDNSIRTIQVSTQETCTDCPTREQALFIADGLWNSLWIYKLFNEPSFLEHFLEATGKAQCDNGLMPSAVFSSLLPPHFLLDFCLIYVWGVDIYRRVLPERKDVVLNALPIAERTLKWFQKSINSCGLVEADPTVLENYPGGNFQITFIDHPGLWHPFSHPGLERSRRQLGLNAFLIIAIEAFIKSAESVNYLHSLDTSILDSARIRSRCHELYWNDQTKFYADCLDDEDGSLKGWSAQSQILAILSGITDGNHARELMTKLVEQRHDPKLCQCTPYFWTYYAEALGMTGLDDQILPLIQEAWSGMSKDPDTTTWWETFEGSPKDTRCHPWAALPAWHLQPAENIMRLVEQDVELPANP
ncbi:hypothetical protein [Cerasicoccus frondis]|uniref:alpha-L-rhamnosidase-related protein n=1 Tax=Cerasicoccus frondis TaxID=490090 RepID=UPI0028529710|nr:hypothetical protein [Cerasicoccus frondis]